MKDITKVVHECVPECSSCRRPATGKIFYKNGRIYCGECARNRGYNR